MMIINSGQWSVGSWPAKTKVKIKIKIFTTGDTGDHGVNLLEFGAEHGDYVIGGDYAYQLVVLVDYGEGD